MKAYKKQIDTVKAVETARQIDQNKPAPEPRQPNPAADARIRFMQNIVGNARVNQ